MTETPKGVIGDSDVAYTARDLEVEGRLSTLEGNLKHMATKAWVLAGVVGGCVLAVGMAMTYVKFFG